MPEEPPRSTRCFIAIHIPAVLIERIVDVRADLQRLVKTDAVRWTQPEQMHVTMKFLGSVPNDRLAALENALVGTVTGSAPFLLSLEAFGCFPSARDPNVFWVGLGGQVEELMQLQGRIAAAMEGFASHEENRAFHPHVTIGRRVKTRSAESRRIAEALAKLRQTKLGQWTVNEVTLMGSKLGPQGAIHTRLAGVQLVG